MLAAPTRSQSNKTIFQRHCNQRGVRTNAPRTISICGTGRTGSGPIQYSAAITVRLQATKVTPSTSNSRKVSSPHHENQALGSRTIRTPGMVRATWSVPYRPSQELTSNANKQPAPSLRSSIRTQSLSVTCLDAAPVRSGSNKLRPSNISPRAHAKAGSSYRCDPPGMPAPGG